jgi:hypothetical protein
MTLESRREAQIDLEHQYYEDSGCADDFAKRGLALHQKILQAVQAAAAAQQRVLAGTEPATAAAIAQGKPEGHSVDLPAQAPRAHNLIAIAVLQQPQFSDNPGDAEVLMKHCTGVSAEAATPPAGEPEPPVGVRITLSFSANPFFKNDTISRVFGLAADASDEISVVNADDGTTIQWLPGKDTTMQPVKKVSRTGPQVRKVPVMSIFRLFTKDGLTGFPGEPVMYFTPAVKVLLKVSAVAVHAACLTRTIQQVPGVDTSGFEDENDE